jgi:predicted porin
MMPDGLKAYIHYSPKADGSAAFDKSNKAVNSSIGHGWDIAVESDGTAVGVDGLTIFAGVSSIEQSTLATDNKTGDRSAWTAGANYAAGSFTVGYQYSRDNLANRTGGSTSFYENDMYGVTFQINVDLSIGYNKIQSNANNNGADNVEASVESVQIAYSMGGASIRLAQANGNNLKYQTGSAYDRDATTLSVSLAF